MASSKPPASQVSDSTLMDTANTTTHIADEKLEIPDHEDKPQEKESKAKIILVFISVFLSMFLVALDRTIISTAIPQITDEFNSITDVGWYGSAYLLTCCAFQLLLGKVYTLYPIKFVLIGNILLFEIGSALCGAAPNSSSFIVGRAISGIGAAGIFAGTVVCIVHIVPLHKRPQFQGLFGGLFGLASIVGPIVGGAFTSHVSWRWCFYINLPLGGVSLLVIFFWLHIPEQETMKHPWAEKLLQLDVVGTMMLVPGVVCLVLAMQWGGQKYDWNNGRIIVLLVLMSVLLAGFAAVQVLIPRTATLPVRIFKQRSVVSGFWQTLCIGSSMYVYIYFLPLWFQTIKGVSAVDSGIRILPFMLSMVVGSMLGGAVTTRVGYYTPFAIVGSCIMSVGGGLLTTLQIDSGPSQWIGYQVVYGLGMGLCFQVPNLAAQTVLPKQDVPIGIALMFFGQLLGAAIFVAVGENVLGNQLVNRLSGVQGIDRTLITEGGATTLLSGLDVELREIVLVAYSEALRKVFQVGLIVTCLAVIGAATLEWRSILKEQAQRDKEAPKEAEDQKA
ncbi:hypothetical protein TWF102_011570 [Orbilia oligospora]|uniref:Major facilitator superfamily (MFS) profile domain-containing protein n=1 Tax=Orbilia oligospora TaxID=2813651 RepID=A0A7C8N630_ORBOL|nr:hypothetical protein TWF102_011570 [Orbilia oligospora]KAF3094606.1 hypothetical protein TWF706_008443 [Orbilia oligospora]KAF3096492.1 hypothetical protein TWF103_009826 [Orbilia oligospora]KAF3133208.1 hypothetical protein TWF703_007050 [Orbilia oligospora]KAF3136049.1 hypothetical protein TWF594_008022 [Orbilia oligospora]